LTTIELPYNFTPRAYQEDFLAAMSSGKKRAVLVWNRRAGKDTTAFNFMICQAMKRVGVYYYVFPTFSQGRKVVWDNINNDGYRFINYVPKELISHKNNHEMKITLMNGSLIQIVGSDNYDSIMGTNPVGCIFSEYSMHDERAWLYIRPIIDANGGWAVFVFTPRGANHAKEMYERALYDETWFAQKLTLEDTHSISLEQLAQIRKEGTPEDYIQQEWYCSFTKGVQGSYYASLVEDAWDEGRVCRVPYDKTQKVYTSWDLGISDSMAIIFFQLCNHEIHIFDYYENTGEGFPHYAKVLHDKGYIYNRHFCPHDIKVRELGSGLSRLVQAADIGLDFTVLDTLKSKVSTGIEALRGLFPRIWIDKDRCAHVVAALTNYRKEYDEHHNIYKDRPLHDKWSHCADAARYMAVAIHTMLNRDGMTEKEIERLRDLYQPRFN
jgi:phage terminase large subunit